MLIFVPRGSFSTLTWTTASSEPTSSVRLAGYQNRNRLVHRTVPTDQRPEINPHPGTAPGTHRGPHRLVTGQSISTSTQVPVLGHAHRDRTKNPPNISQTASNSYDIWQPAQQWYLMPGFTCVSPDVVRLGLQSRQTFVTVHQDQELPRLVEKPRRCLQRASLFTKFPVVTSYHQCIPGRMGLATQSEWLSVKTSLHIYLRAVRNTCTHFLPLNKEIHTRVLTHNIACLHYIN